MFSAERRWALAMAGVLTEINGAHHHELGGWGPGDHTARWSRDALSRFWSVEDAPGFERISEWLWREGHRMEAFAGLRHLSPDPSLDDARSAILRANAASLQGRSLLAWDLGRFVAITGWGHWSGYVAEDEAWRRLHGAATWAQRRYRSWEDLGRGYELGRLYWSQGDEDPKCAAALDKLLIDPASPWRTLPWSLPLG